MSREKRTSAESVGMSDVSATARLRTHFNVEHMIAAAYFAREALEIESENDTTLIEGELFHAHIGYNR